MVSSPNKIENLRKILEYSCEKVTRIELFKYIGDEFNLKVSSIESMMPFLKASGLLEEVGRNIYITSSVAKEWCETGVDIDFIRILHCHYRFVGEMILLQKTMLQGMKFIKKQRNMVLIMKRQDG